MYEVKRKITNVAGFLAGVLLTVAGVSNTVYYGIKCFKKK
jgi:hypothetical protein